MYRACALPLGVLSKTNSCLQQALLSCEWRGLAHSVVHEKGTSMGMRRKPTLDGMRVSAKAVAPDANFLGCVRALLVARSLTALSSRAMANLWVESYLEQLVRDCITRMHMC